MSLYERYELLDLSRDDGVKTFEAREIATGRPLKVHLFVHPTAPLQVALLKAIEQLPDSERQRIIERGKHEGTPYVVTDRLVDYAGLSEWVQAAGHHGKAHPNPAPDPPLGTAGAWKVPPAPALGAPASPPSSPAQPPAGASRPGASSSLNQQFAELFPTAERPIVADSLLEASQPPPSIAAPLRPPAPQPPAAPPPQAKQEAGEFTRMFQTPAASAPTSPPAMAPPAPAPASPQAPQVQAKKEAGEFTRMFQAPTAPAPAPPSTPAPAPPQAPQVQAKKEAGEFTRMFQAPTAPVPAPPSTPAPAPPQASPQQALPQQALPQQALPQQALPQQALPQPTRQEAGEFTRMFQAPGVPASPGAPSAPAPPPAGSKSGPGDFTRFFETPSPAGPMPHSPAVQQPLTPQGPGSSGHNRVSEFTRTFGKGELDTPPAPPPAALPPKKEPGEFTRMFPSPGASAPPPAAPPQAAARPEPPAMGSGTQGFSTPPPPPAAPKQSGPGEYTRQFSAPAELTFGQTSATPSAPRAASPAPAPFVLPAMGQPAMPNLAQAPVAPKKSNLPLILGIVGIVVVAVLIVVFFAMRPK